MLAQVRRGRSSERQSCTFDERNTRTDSAILARQGDKEIVAATVAVTAHETVRKDAALHVVAKLVLDVTGHGPFVSFACEREKGLEVLANDAV